MSANSWIDSLMGSRMEEKEGRKTNVKKKEHERKSTMHTIEQSSLMGEEGVLLFSTSSTSSSFSFDMEVNGSILYCERFLLIKKHCKTLLSPCQII